MKIKFNSGIPEEVPEDNTRVRRRKKYSAIKDNRIRQAEIKKKNKLLLKSEAEKSYHEDYFSPEHTIKLGHYNNERPKLNTKKLRKVEEIIRVVKE